MSSKNLVYVLNGANINMLEFRSPAHYHGAGGAGGTSYNHLCETLVREGDTLGLRVEVWQSNSESAMVDKVQSIAMEHVYAPSAETQMPTPTQMQTQTPTQMPMPMPMVTDNVGVIVNAGGYTHTSVVIRDALELLAPIPIVEVHMSNIFARERFRHHSHISGISHGVIAGLGVYSYVAALHYIANLYAMPTKQIQK